jgi:hypothetical protein
MSNLESTTAWHAAAVGESAALRVLDATQHCEAEEVPNERFQRVFFRSPVWSPLVLTERLGTLFGDDSTRLLSIGGVVLKINWRFESCGSPGGKVHFDVSAC